MERSGPFALSHTLEVGGAELAERNRAVLLVKPEQHPSLIRCNHTHEFTPVVTAALHPLESELDAREAARLDRRDVVHEPLGVLSLRRPKERVDTVEGDRAGHFCFFEVRVGDR